MVKNKLAPPFTIAEFDINFGEGISKEGDLLDLAVIGKVVEKSGSWFSYAQERLGQGRENSKQFLKDNPDIASEIDNKVKVVLGITKPLKEVESVGK